MNENLKPVPVAAAPAPGVPGVPVGSASAQPVAANDPLAVAARLAAGKPAVEKKPFGGNVGRKTRADGLKPGSPEALAADREADRERKRRERAARAAVTPPPPLPAGAPPPVEPMASADAPPAAAVAGEFADPVCLWTAGDLEQFSVEVVSLSETALIASNTKLAADGGLPERVVKKIAADSAFPPGSKKSLSAASPVVAAKLFNALKVPVAAKPFVGLAPSLAIIVRSQLALREEIKKLVAEHREHLKQTEPAKN